MLLSGCQPTPETEAIAQKQDINQVVAEHEDESGSVNVGVPLREQLGAPDNTSFEVSVGDGSMKITADHVPVIIPDTDKAGSGVIRKAEFSLEQVKTMTESFFDGRTVNKVKPTTKQDRLAAIAHVQEEINKSDDEAYISQLEDHIRVYQEGIEDLPDEDSIIVEPLIFEWTEIGGADGVSLNGENRGNGKIYEVGASIRADMGAYLYLSKDDENKMTGTMEKSSLEQSIKAPQYAGELKEQEEAFTTNVCTYTQEQAVALCMDFLNENGIDTTALFVMDVQPYICYAYEQQIVYPGIQGYHIYMAHGLGEMPPVRAENPIMYTPGNSDIGSDSEGVLPYQYESLMMSVDSSGLTYLQWSSYMEPGETLTESVSLKPYSEIEEIIKNHIAISYENYMFYDGFENGKSLDLSKITLSMMRIQNENDETNFTLIPVWDVFEKSLGNMSLMTVNAMDGSIINRERGY